MSPSKVKFSSALAALDVPSDVIIRLSTALDIVSNPVPDVPVDPEEPLDPVEPEVPDDPADPLVPEDPEVPADPEVPDDPELPVDPDEPEVPDDPDDPEVPEEPLPPEPPACHVATPFASEVSTYPACCVPSTILTAPLVVEKTCNLVVGDAVPAPMLPDASITNGVVSGFALSSTTSAFPVPVCVILTMSLVLDADAIIEVTFIELVQLAKPLPSASTNNLLIPSVPSCSFTE